jgi:hypothetical protein
VALLRLSPWRRRSRPPLAPPAPACRAPRRDVTTAAHLSNFAGERSAFARSNVAGVLKSSILGLVQVRAERLVQVRAEQPVSSALHSLLFLLPIIWLDGVLDIQRGGEILASAECV